MEASEVRLGNHLKWVDNGAEFSIDLPLIISKEFWNHVINEDIEPIPLTKEWLIKFGIILGWTDGFYFYTFEGSPLDALYRGNGLREVEIKYVHQLQNIWLDLRGEELQVKE